MSVADNLRRNDESGTDEKERANFPFETIVGLSVISAIYEDNLEKIDIVDYRLISFDDRTLKIQVNFAQPSYISVDFVNKEQLEVRFLKTWFFIASDGN